MSDMADAGGGSSGLSVAALVCGGLALISVPTGFCCSFTMCASTPLAIAGLVLGLLARQGIAKGTVNASSGTMATIGMVTGGIALVGELGMCAFSLAMGGLQAALAMFENFS